MEVLDFNKINGHEKEVNELIRLAKATKSVRMYKRYAVVLKHF